MSRTDSPAQPPGPVEAPRQERSRRTMHRLLDAAAELMEERPFDDIRVDEIARRAGYTKGAFYHRFDDKAALLRHLDGRLFEEALEGWDAFLDPEAWEGRGLDALAEAFVRRLVGVYRRSGGLMRAFVHQARWGDDDAVRERARTLNGFVRDRLLALIEARRDELRPSLGERPAEAVDLWLAACAGALGQLVLFPEEHGPGGGRRPSAERLEEEAVSLLVPYLTGEVPA